MPDGRGALFSSRCTRRRILINRIYTQGISKRINALVVTSSQFSDFNGIDPIARGNSISNLLGVMASGFVVLLLSHGISYSVNFLKGGEKKHATINKLMRQPYVRILPMHLIVIFGASFLLSIEQALFPMVIIVAGKLIADIISHNSEHKQS